MTLWYLCIWSVCVLGVVYVDVPAICIHTRAASAQCLMYTRHALCSTRHVSSCSDDVGYTQCRIPSCASSDEASHITQRKPSFPVSVMLWEAAASDWRKRTKTWRSLLGLVGSWRPLHLSGEGKNKNCRPSSRSKKLGLLYWLLRGSESNTMQFYWYIKCYRIIKASSWIQCQILYSMWPKTQQRVLYAFRGL